MEKTITNWQHIDAVIFDLGGVILNLDYQKTIDAFSHLAGKNAAELYTQHKQNPLFDDIETGRIAEEEFRTKLQSLFGITATDQALDRAWNALLLDIPKERLSFLEEVKNRKRTFLLSNTNSIHKAAFDNYLQETHKMRALDPLFEKAYYSHLMGDRKPNASIFQKVIDENALEPSKTLFIDDSPQHLETAKKIGLHVFNMRPPYSILDLKF